MNNQLLQAAKHALEFIQSIDGYENGKTANELRQAIEAAEHSVQADKCPCCLGKGKVEDNFEIVECWVCDGTGIRR